MLRWIENKNWRKNIDACWETSDKVNQCINNSSTFASFDQELKSIVKKSVSKNFIPKYIHTWASGQELQGDEGNFLNSNSDLWEKNREGLEALNTECNLFALNECCKEKYNLDNLQGDIEWTAQTIKK
jgi:hypothetical protein